MNPTIELEPESIRKLNAAIEDFVRSTGRDVSKVLKDQARLLVRDVMKATPPFGGSTFHESWNTQRKIGLEAVERDIRKVFISLREFVDQVGKNNKELADALAMNGGISEVSRKTGKRKFRASRVDMEALRAIFRNMRMDGLIIMEASSEVHARYRNRRGRVGRADRHVVILERSIERYIKQVQERVGLAKGGWMKAANALLVKGIPRWIAKHVVPGVFRDKSEDEMASVTIGNLVSYEGDFNRRQFEAAMDYREYALRMNLQKLMEAKARKANAGTV